MKFEELISSNYIRNHYKNKFRDLSLSRSPGVPPFKTTVKIGKTTHLIRVGFVQLSECHPDIYANNAINPQPDGSLVATIIADISIFDLPKSQQKEILAHEYVEVLKTFHDGSRLKAVLGREEFIIFMALAEPDRPPIFQDDPQDFADIARATDILLVSKDSVSKILLEKSIQNFDELHELMTTSPTSAKEKVGEVADYFESKLFTPSRIVKNRVYEFLSQ